VRNCFDFGMVPWNRRPETCSRSSLSCGQVIDLVSAVQAVARNCMYSRRGKFSSRAIGVCPTSVGRSTQCSEAQDAALLTATVELTCFYITSLPIMHQFIYLVPITSSSFEVLADSSARPGHKMQLLVRRTNGLSPWGRTCWTAESKLPRFPVPRIGVSHVGP
jgi:hypothetical protein